MAVRYIDPAPRQATPDDQQPRSNPNPPEQPKSWITVRGLTVFTLIFLVFTVAYHGL
jgi:hypothetical protein